jgi:hypothetical protein
MAKTCDVCNKTYPDELKACPHCAAESIDFAPAEGEESDEPSAIVRLSDPEAPMKTSDSDIELAESLAALEEPPKEPASGTSSVNWASLVEDVAKKPADEAPAKAKFDSPSDKDLLEKASRTAKPPRPAAPPPSQEADAIVVFDDGNAIGMQPGTLEASDSGNILADPNQASDASLPELEVPPPEAVKTTPKPPSGVKIDSPSDKDLLRHADTLPQVSTGAGSSADLELPPELAGPPSGSSMVRWDALVDEAARAAGGSGSDIKIDAPSDTSMLRHLREEERAREMEELSEEGGELGLPVPKPPADIDLTEEVFEAESSSDVDLRPPSPSPRPSPADFQRPKGTEELSPESVEVGPGSDASPLEAGSDSGSDPDIFPAEDGSTVNLGETPSRGERPSGRSRYAEPVESGLDLDRLIEASSSSPSGIEGQSSPVDSSSVDLGATYGSGSSASGDEPSSGSVAAELLGSDSGRRPHPRAADSGEEEMPSSRVDLGTPAEAGSSGSRAEEEEAPVATKERPAAKPRPGLGWVGSGLAGAVVGAGACVGLWFAGLWLPGEWRGDKPSAPPRGGTPVQPAPSVMDVNGAIRHVRTGGDLKEALPVLQQQAGDNKEALAARGEALWLQYLLQQRQGGKPLQADDEAVKQAVADLQKADTADALFWLGHIQEVTGQADKARATYADGLKRFEQRRFQAALDRLEALAPEKAARLPSLGEQLVLLLLALQAPAEAANDEAGYEFWSAVKLAQQGKYGEAAKALEKARATHDRQRYNRLRKAQNPLSDPTEEIFLKACDELKSAWQVRDQLQQKGYLDAARSRDPLKAVEGLPPLAEMAVLKTAADNLKKETEAREAAEKNAKEAEAKAKVAQKAAEEARKEADAKARATAVLEEKWKSADGLAKSAGAKLQAVTARLEAAGVKQTDPVRGVDELLAARKGTEAVLDDVVRKLKDGKYLPADAKPTDAARGVETLLSVAKTTDPGGKLPPALRRPESLEVANPLAAEQHYAIGLRLFNARDYAAAEKEFLAAVESDSQDARYYYFLGLSRLSLNKSTEAFEDFEQGARLEQQGRPGRRAVNAALERVQGGQRQAVNRYRP